MSSVSRGWLQRSGEASQLIQGGSEDSAAGGEPCGTAHLGPFRRRDGLSATELPCPRLRADRQALRTSLVGPQRPTPERLTGGGSAVWANTPCAGCCSLSPR